jgi:hypothetical protein
MRTRLTLVLLRVAIVRRAIQRPRNPTAYDSPERHGLVTAGPIFEVTVVCCEMCYASSRIHCLLSYRQTPCPPCISPIIEQRLDECGLSPELSKFIQLIWTRHLKDLSQFKRTFQIVESPRGRQQHTRIDRSWTSSNSHLEWIWDYLVCWTITHHQPLTLLAISHGKSPSCYTSIIASHSHPAPSLAHPLDSHPPYSIPPGLAPSSPIS